MMADQNKAIILFFLLPIILVGAVLLAQLEYHSSAKFQPFQQPQSAPKGDYLGKPVGLICPSENWIAGAIDEFKPIN